MSDPLGHHLLGSGPSGVIVLHDWMGDASEWEQATPYLDADAFSYAFTDVRGYGLSQNLTGEYTASEIAGDVFALADHLGWKTFSLVGHSMTGMATQRALIDDDPSDPRIERAVAVSPVTANGYPADDETKQFLWAAIEDAEMAIQAFTMLTGGRIAPAWAAQRAARFNDVADKDAVRGYYEMWLNSGFGAEAAQAAPKTAFQVIGGRNDLPGFDEDTYRSTIGQWFPNATFEFVTDAGHYAMQETPIRAAHLIEAHLSGSRQALPHPKDKQ